MEAQSVTVASIGSSLAQSKILKKIKAKGKNRQKSKNDTKKEGGAHPWTKDVLPWETKFQAEILNKLSYTGSSDTILHKQSTDSIFICT